MKIGGVPPAYRSAMSARSDRFANRRARVTNDGTGPTRAALKGVAVNFEDHFDDAVVRGRENARVIELSHNHCQHMEFVVAGGYGMLEEVSGLPINMRRIRCIKAHGNTAAPQLMRVARAFYEEHCTGCTLRKPSGRLPTLAALVEADQRAEAETARLAAERDMEAARHRAERGMRRRALQVSADPAMTGALQDLDVVDGEPSEDDTRISAAIRRLTALADKAPQSFTDSVISEMLKLAGIGHFLLLGPLRIVSRSREEWRRAGVDAAFSALDDGASQDAARMLVQFQDVTHPEQYTANVVRSLLYVAYGPYNSDIGYLEASTATDPATLQLLAHKASETLTLLLDRMLPGPPQKSALELPSGARTVEPAEGMDAEFDRATAAAAVRQLLSSGDPLAARFVPALIRNLLIDGDQYNTHPHAAVQQTLAAFILFRTGGAEEMWWAAGASASDDQRQTLFSVWWHLSRLVDPERQWESNAPELSIGQRRELRTRVFEVSMRLAAGQWGYNVAGSAADIILGFARDDPEWAAARTDTFLGGFLAALNASEEPRPKVLVPNDDTPDFVANMEWSTRGNVLRSAAARFLDATREAARAEPVPVAQAVLAFLEHERDQGNPEEIGWQLLPLLGEIGRDGGGAPGVLPLIVPALYTHLMSSSPALVDRAIRAWADVNSRNILPSLFEDLLPILMDQRYIRVILAMLNSLPRLNLPESVRREGLRYAVLWLTSSRVGGPNEQLVQPAIECAGRLIQQLPDDQVNLERLLLRETVKLPPHEVREVLWVNWSIDARHSPEYARVRLARVINSQTNPAFSRRNNEEEVALLECGRGLLGLELSELQDAALSFGPERISLGLEIVEVAWRAGRVDDARTICDALQESIPDQPAFERKRALAQWVKIALWGNPPPASDGKPFDDNGFPSFLFRVIEQVQARAVLRGLLITIPATAAEFSASAARLQDEAEKLAALAQRDTPTAAYVRLLGDLFEVAAHVHLLEAADLGGKPRSADAHRRAIYRLATALNEKATVVLGSDDPLGGPLTSAVAQILGTDDGDLAAVVADWASLPIPLVLIEGASLSERDSPKEPPPDVEEEAVAVAMISVDDRLLTGAAVLRPDTVYTLKIELQVDEWPEWAERLDLQFVGGLTASEIQLPTLVWRRSPNFNGTLRGEGTLVLRFALPSGRPAPPFAVTASWSGQVENQMRRKRLDITGHSQIRLRPFDAARDALTEIDVVDERLHALYSSLFAAGYPDDEIQAFCRLFTAVCRFGFRYTWDKRYRRGSRVTEREFHNDLYTDLLEDLDLGGRVERGSPLGLGYLDIRHDRITAELKVERRVPVTKESAPKYMAQATQYASADGRHLAILAILDMSPKESPVGTPENNVFTLVPSLHGLDSPDAPSLIAVAVVNGNLPVPSAWSRRKSPRPD